MPASLSYLHPVRAVLALLVVLLAVLMALSVVPPDEQSAGALLAALGLAMLLP